MFAEIPLRRKAETYQEKIRKLRDILQGADNIVIGAGAGLSTSAGFVMTESGLKSTFQISGRNTVFTICIREDSALMIRWRNTGPTEQVYLAEPVYGCAEAGL